MRKFLLMGLTVLLLMVIAGCGGAAEAPTAAPPTQPPPTDTPAVAKEEESQATGSGVSAKLQAYADEHANGPGAIFVGDLG